MVSGSAVVAALSAIIMGAVSDRYRGKWGRRKLFILIGFPIAGLFTILFPFGDTIKNVGLAVLFVVLADCLMMFGFGTANDGVLSGYITDITNNRNRGRVLGVLQVVSWVAFLVIGVAGGIIVQKLGYYHLFIGIGVMLIIVGILGGLMLQEKQVPMEDLGSRRISLWLEIISSFKWKNIIEYKKLFIVLISVTVWGCGWYAVQPYLLVYLMKYLGYSAAQAGMIQALPLFAGILFSVPVGALSDKWGRKNTAILLVILMALSVFSFSLLKPGSSLVAAILFASFIFAPVAGWYTCYKAWARDLYPEDKRGQFSGITLLFVVTIPMVIGSQIGSMLTSSFGLPTVVDGKSGFIPTPIIFQVATVIILLSIIPLVFCKGKENKTAPESAVKL